MAMTPTDIAAKLRQHSPGCLPESLTIEDHYGVPAVHAHGVYLRSDIAEAVLRDAMCRTGFIIRKFDGTDVAYYEAYREVMNTFHDCDHGGSLGACYAAWCWAKGIGNC